MNEISLFRGNDRRIEVTILRKSTGLAYNLTNCTITMLIKKDINDADADAIITKSTTDSDEGVILDAINGVVEFYLIPDDTDDAVDILQDNVVYPVDFEVETLAHKKYTILRTSFTIIKR
jgi:hypothetical protein